MPARRFEFFRFRPHVESLEHRDVPATFVVSNTAGADQIVFAIGTGPQSITITSVLPAITETVQILCNTQPGFTDPSNINPDGSPRTAPKKAG